MSNRLPVLQSDISRALSEGRGAATLSAQRFIDAGTALNEAKDLCSHGDWLPFLEGIGLHQRTAQRYMKLAASNLKSDSVSDLGGISSALKFLRLREAALHHMENAHAAAIAIENGKEADELTPLAWALAFMDDMIRMFPDSEEQANG